MSGRRGWLGLVALAILVLAVIAVWRLGGRGGGEEAEVATEVPVRVGALTRTTLRRVVEAFGTLETAPAEKGRAAAGSRVASPVTGTVAAVSCYEGQRVTRGAELVRLDSRVADAQVARARKAVAFAELAAKRQSAMMASEATSQRALQEAEQAATAARSDLAAAQAERDLLHITAPVAGTVVKLNARPGEAVDPGVVLLEIADLGRLLVSAGVRAADAGLVRTGQSVEVATADPEKPLVGTVAFVGSQVDTRSDTVSLRVALPAGSGLLPGSFLELRIVVEARECLAAPEDAVVRDAEGGTAVAVVEGDRAVLTKVRAGLHEKGLVEVAGEGLKEGTAIVTEGAYGLPQETKVKPVGP